MKPPVDKHCRRCGRTTKTECYRHCENRIIKFELGGGGIMGGKIDDRLTAWICQKCDSELSAPLPKDCSEEFLLFHAVEWFKAIFKTWLL